MANTEPHQPKSLLSHIKNRSSHQRLAGAVLMPLIGASLGWLEGHMTGLLIGAIVCDAIYWIVLSEPVWQLLRPVREWIATRSNWLPSSVLGIVCIAIGATILPAFEQRLSGSLEARDITMPFSSVDACQATSIDIGSPLRITDIAGAPLTGHGMRLHGYELQIIVTTRPSHGHGTTMFWGPVEFEDNGHNNWHHTIYPQEKDGYIELAYIPIGLTGTEFVERWLASTLHNGPQPYGDSLPPSWKLCDRTAKQFTFAGPGTNGGPTLVYP